MIRRLLSAISAALFLSTAIASAQQQTKPAVSASIVQPGAPGQPGKVLKDVASAAAVRAPSAADVSFMQGMIMHHSQAVEMTDLMKARTTNKRLLALGERISISQSDEMQYMKQWLEDRGAPVSMSHNMAGMQSDHMDHMKMAPMANSMPLMPGMLTPAQMKALAAATGPAFDHLFLTGMIQHHTGALTMVMDLFDTAGAGQEPVLFDFANDIDNTQRAEIEIMQGMLREEK